MTKWFKDLFTPTPKPKRYLIDWDKVKSKGDIITILSAIYPNINIPEDSGLFEKFEHMLKEVKDD